MKINTPEILTGSDIRFKCVDGISHFIVACSAGAAVREQTHQRASEGELMGTETGTYGVAASGNTGVGSMCGLESGCSPAGSSTEPTLPLLRSVLCHRPPYAAYS